MTDRADLRILFTIACMLTFTFIAAQEPKPPEAVDDQAVTIQGGQKVDISSLSRCQYLIRLYNLEGEFATKFIKND
jgi:hypothetical protein